MIKCIAAGVVVAAFSTIAVSQSVSSETTASNGVAVFIDRIESSDRDMYASPVMEIDGNQVFVVRTDTGGAHGELELSGVSSYRGGWRLYDAATFIGGKPARYTDGPKEVGGDCQSSPNSHPNCKLNEHFSISISSSEIADYAQNGHLRFELSSSHSAEIAKFSIPVSYLDAVREVADAR